mmetsp:Transcript_23596/g.72583  ORF Transcript_23596/g.72583 Transcript_23596/m.72583 type:complete len:177 (+) Transcript_23596:786-1316(+)
MRRARYASSAVRPSGTTNSDPGNAHVASKTRKFLCSSCATHDAFTKPLRIFLQWLSTAPREVPASHETRLTSSTERDVSSTMVYLAADGTVLKRRSPWRLSIVSDAFWVVVNFVSFFFQTMFDPESAHHSLRPQKFRSSGGGGGGGGSGGGGGGGRRVRGMGDLSASRMRGAVAGG